MPEILLAVKPGSQLSIGTGPVTFSSATAPHVTKGDPWMLKATGQQPGLGEIGVLMPWDTAQWPIYVGSIGQDGSLLVFGAATADADLGSGRGILVAAGVLPPGGPPVNPFGYRSTEFIPAGPPPPPPTPGFPYLIALVKASRSSHVPVADWIADADRSVMYTYAPPYAVTPFIVNLAWSVCLTDAASGRIAAALGGTVVKDLPPDWADPFVAPGTHPPLVNYIHAVKDGVPVKALAQDVAQSFNGDLDNSIPAVFKAV